MGFRINTNIAAMDAHRNSTMNNIGLDRSLKSLSSGLRINTAADDASGMAIANSLRAQSTGLGQAIRNANDGIGVVQTADGALDEYQGIINTVRTKAIQAASDGQNADSRAAIQRDIDKLLEEAQNIVDTTAFNGLKLLNGSFTNKNFQIGAYANETVGVSIQDSSTTSVGKLATSTSVVDGGTNLDTLASGDITSDATPVAGEWAGPIASTSSSTGVRINGYNASGNLTAQGSDMLSAKGIAAAANMMTETTGVTASATNEWTMTNSVTAGTIATGGLVINGFDIGNVTVKANDADGSLVSAINAKQSDTGVTAAVSATGVLTLTAEDGRNIQISNTSGTDSSVLLNGGTTVDNKSITSIAFSAVSNSTAYTFNLDGANITFTSDASATTTEASAGILAALQAAQTAGTISANYSFADTDGEVTIARTDGKDVNVLIDSDNSAQMTFHTNVTAVTDGSTGTAQANGGAYNNARHGQVTFTSDENISIEGDTETLATFGLTGKSASATGGIADADVTTFEAAQTTIQRADSALKALDEIRSNLGSTQNQLESTIRNISVTQVNVAAAESQIRDVDFAAESATFAKHNILAQSGAYAMSQANAVQQNVMRLLQ